MITKPRLFFLLLFGASILSAQDFQGIATYKTKDKIQIELDSTQVGGMQDEIMTMLQKEFEKTFILTFDKEQSVYKEDEALAPPSVGGSVVFGTTDGGFEVLYKNLKEQRYTKQTEFLGKLFLIKDSIKKNDWKLHADTKNIGTYSCYKATLERPVKSFFSDEPTKTQVITAWYAPQIPISNGPDGFQGLPGLILELSYDSKIILCSKVILNPRKQIAIEAPTKGESVSQSEYDQIVEKKMKQMSFQSDGRGNGVSIEVEVMD